VTSPAEEIISSARRGLQCVTDGVHDTNAYDRTAFSDLRVFYNNLYKVAEQAARIEAVLTRLGVNFEVDDQPEHTPAQIEGFIRNISGINDLCRGSIPSANGDATATDTIVSGVTRKIQLRISPRLNGVQQTFPLSYLRPPPIPDWFKFNNEPD